MVADKASYEGRIKELHGFMGKNLHQLIKESNDYLMEAMESEIKEVEKESKNLLK